MRQAPARWGAMPVSGKGGGRAERGSCRILAQNQPNGLPLAPQPGWLRPGPPLEEHRLDLEGEADPEGGAGGCRPSTQLTAAWVLPGAREDDASATGTSFAK